MGLYSVVVEKEKGCSSQTRDEGLGRVVVACMTVRRICMNKECYFCLVLFCFGENRGDGGTRSKEVGKCLLRYFPLVENF